MLLSYRTMTSSSVKAMRVFCASRHVDPARVPVIVDLAAGRSREGIHVDIAPTILANRAKSRSLWITNLNRPLCSQDYLMLQGFEGCIQRLAPGIASISPAELGEMLGNAMTYTVLEAIMAKSFMVLGL